MDSKDIKEINDAISDSLYEWSDVMAIADSEGWSVCLNYSDEDVFNALYIFNHVAQNIAIKNGWYKCGEDVIEKMDAYKEAIRVAFGFDTVKLTKKIFENEQDEL